MPDKVSGSVVGRAASVPRRLLLVLLITAAFMVVEAVAGWVSGALALSLASALLARRPADPCRIFGFLRVEILAALVNGAALFGMAAWVVVEAIGRLGTRSRSGAGSSSRSRRPGWR